MTRMKVTITGYYVADTDDYEGVTDPQKMAAIDQGNCDGEPILAVGLMDRDLPFGVTVETDG